MAGARSPRRAADPSALPAVDAWPLHRIAWVGGLFIAVIAAFAGYDMWRGYQQAVADTRRELDAQSRVIAEQTARSVQAVDVMLRQVATEFQRGRLARLDEQELHVYLRDIAVGLHQIDGLGLFDAQGEQLAVSWPAPRRAVNMGSLPRFQQLREQPGLGFVIFGAARAAGDGHWIVPFGRRVETPDGRFAGVVAARGRVEYFERFYRDAYPDPATRVALLHRDGTLLARHPASAAALGQHFAALEPLLPGPDGQPRASRGISPIDGVDRFAAIRLVPDYPLVVVVTREAGAALASWRAQAIGSAWRTLALGTLAVLLMALLWRQLLRLSSARGSLAQSQERYALAAAGSDTGVWDWDLVAGSAFESRRARELQGLPLEPETQPLEELKRMLTYHPDDAPKRAFAMQAHLDGATPHYEVEYRVRRADGEYRWIHVRALCIRDSDGRPLRIAGSVSDIDARRRAEEALRESEQRFAVAVAGADDGIWEWDFVKHRAYGSRRGRELLGLPPEPEVESLDAWAAEMAGQIHPDDRARRDQAVADHLAGRSPAYVVDFRVRRPDGQWRWVHVHGRCERDADGRPLRMAGSASDIDARKRTEEALRESEERYALAMVGWRGGHWVWNEADDSLFVSATAKALFGLPADTGISSRAEFMSRITLHPDDRERVLQLIEAHTRGDGARQDYECRIVLPDGSVRWILNRAQRFPAPDGQASRVAGVVIDITERKQADDARERLEQQLRQAQKLEAIGTLAGGIAHDFNNILSAILGYGELAQKGAPEGTPLRRHIDASIAAGQRAKSLVERILAFSRSGIGERVPVHVQSVVNEALDAVAGSLPPAVALERSLAAGDAGVLGDPTQIHQVVMNLCANAVQAMKSEGQLAVVLNVAPLAAPLAVTTHTLAAGRYLRLSVADSGSGIAPELLTRIFDPFFTTKEVGVGTGLGLSLVHGIVTDLGGGIAVDSQVGRGSRFTVYLPVQTDAASPVAGDGPRDSERGSGQVVLLVDDEEALVRLGEEALAEIGYEPVGFTSSLAALEALRADPTRFDLLLSDEAMPGLTGTELARAVRELRPDLPIVLASGYVTPALRERARAAGVAEVLAKPLATDEVARALAAAWQCRDVLKAEEK